MFKNLGYVIVPKNFKIYKNPDKIKNYRGVDREPITSIELCPLPDEEDIENSRLLLFKKNLSIELGRFENDFGFIKKYDKALYFYNIIKREICDVDLLLCKKYLKHDISNKNTIAIANSKNFIFLGYDIAYEGSDFFSAIWNGLLGDLFSIMSNYMQNLNSYMLFDNIDVSVSFKENYLKLK